MLCRVLNLFNQSFEALKPFFFRDLAKLELFLESEAHLSVGLKTELFETIGKLVNRYLLQIERF